VLLLARRRGKSRAEAQPARYTGSQPRSNMQGLVEELIGMPVERDQPLMEAGLDSIGSVELRNLVRQPSTACC